MNDAYEYFTATLPFLDFEYDPPMSNEAFLEESERLLSKDDYSILEKFLSQTREKINVNDDTVNALAQFNLDFLNELVWFRAERAHKGSVESAGKTRAGNLSIIETVQQAAKMPNLLEAEKMMDKVRWQHWDNFLMGRNNGLAYMIVYGLKLKILNRTKKINSPKGREIFEEIKNMEMPI